MHAASSDEPKGCPQGAHRDASLRLAPCAGDVASNGKHHKRVPRLSGQAAYCQVRMLVLERMERGVWEGGTPRGEHDGTRRIKNNTTPEAFVWRV